MVISRSTRTSRSLTTAVAVQPPEPVPRRRDVSRRRDVTSYAALAEQPNFRWVTASARGPRGGMSLGGSRRSNVLRTTTTFVLCTLTPADATEGATAAASASAANGTITKRRDRQRRRDM